MTFDNEVILYPLRVPPPLRVHGDATSHPIHPSNHVRVCDKVSLELVK